MPKVETEVQLTITVTVKLLHELSDEAQLIISKELHGTPDYAHDEVADFLATHDNEMVAWWAHDVCIADQLKWYHSESEITEVNFKGKGPV